MHRSGAKTPAKGRRTKAPTARKASRTRSPTDNRQKQLVERLKLERDEALELQAASSEVLKIISSSPSNLKSVFEAMLANALRICEAKFGHVLLYDGERFHAAHLNDVPPAYRTFWEQHGPISPSPKTALGRLVLTKQVAHIPDLKADPAYAEREPLRVVTVEQAGARSFLAVPMLKENELIGTIIIYRQEVRPFAEKQIDLVKSFADQAVIAIQNVRLFDEVQAKTRDLEESLRQQTATADVLKVISRSTFDLDAVLTTLAESATKLSSATMSFILLRDGDVLRLRAHSGHSPDFVEFRRTNPTPASRRSATARAFLTGKLVHVPDSLADPDYTLAESQREFRAILGVPMIRDSRVEGVFGLSRREPGPFSDREIELVRTFVDQALIAIENVRLFEQVRAKTRDLEESLQQQTATSEVLKVISRSTFDLQVVLDTLTESAARLCDADSAAIARQGADGGYYHATRYNFSSNWERVSYSVRLRPERGSLVGRVLLARKAVQIPDVLADPEYAYPEQQKAGEYRTLLGVPLLRSGDPIGVLFLCRKTVNPFSDKQVELVQTFADQAVIAIENVRLFDEVQAKTRDLEESLQQQTATADVLKVISRSTFDLQTVLNTLVSSAARLCDADMAFIMRREDDVYRAGAAVGFSEEYVHFLETHPITPDRGTITGRAVIERRTVQIHDVAADPEYTLRESTRMARQRTALGVPLLRENDPIGVIVIARKRVEEFSEKQIELVSTFADQAVIAIENVRLFDELRRRTNDLTASLEDLRTAQDRLIQTEKLASLGQLTAGIAHEIKNPLNFVNNFSALSVELTDELSDVLKQATFADKIRAEVEELTGLLKDNLGKVVQHGKRADSIVKNMLLHSREGSGERRSVDINALVGESLNLAYHGARAEKAGFNITLKQDLDPGAGAVDMYPQEMTRALINLISNGFYAATRRKIEAGDEIFEPALSAATRNLGKTVEIRIRDNGTGISPEVREKMFNPFFTTKPTGEGTGLGLSMTHDIIVKQHGGRIDVETEPGVFTEFIVTLPRGAAASFRIVQGAGGL
jgi:two-component system NtrC family sensor kinase